MATLPPKKYSPFVYGRPSVRHYPGFEGNHVLVGPNYGAHPVRLGLRPAIIAQNTEPGVNGRPYGLPGTDTH